MDPLSPTPPVPAESGPEQRAQPEAEHPTASPADLLSRAAAYREIGYSPAAALRAARLDQEEIGQ